MGFESIKATVSRIWNEIEGGWIYDDSRLNRTLVRDKVLVIRAELLGQLFKTTLGQMPLIYYQSCCFDIHCEPFCAGSPLTVWRGKIPSTIGMGGKAAIRYLGTVDFQQAFEQRFVVSANKGDYSLFGTYSQPQPYYLLEGNQVTVYDAPAGVTKLVVQLVAANPFECPECEEENVYVPADHLQEIEKRVKLDLSGFLIQRKIDKRNNTNADA